MDRRVTQIIGREHTRESSPARLRPTLQEEALRDRSGLLTCYHGGGPQLPLIEGVVRSALARIHDVRLIENTGVETAIRRTAHHSCLANNAIVICHPQSHSSMVLGEAMASSQLLASRWLQPHLIGHRARPQFLRTRSPRAKPVARRFEYLECSSRSNAQH